MRKILSLGVLMAFVMASCSSDDSTSDASQSCTSTIPFLQTGKVLNYNMTQFGFPSGTMKLTFGDCNGSGFLVNRKILNTAGDQISASTDLMKQDGDFLLVDSSNNGDYFSKTYKKNATLGQTWQYTRPDNSVVTHEVVDIDSLITVPAGTFHCKVFKYTTTSAINESHIFWHDEIGNIKEDGGFFTMELSSYN
ncbi:hypothetical protein [Flavobacterium pedocola]